MPDFINNSDVADRFSASGHLMDEIAKMRKSEVHWSKRELLSRVSMLALPILFVVDVVWNASCLTGKVCICIAKHTVLFSIKDKIHINFKSAGFHGWKTAAYLVEAVVIAFCMVNPDWGHRIELKINCRKYFSPCPGAKKIDIKKRLPNFKSDLQTKRELNAEPIETIPQIIHEMKKEADEEAAWQPKQEAQASTFEQARKRFAQNFQLKPVKQVPVNTLETPAPEYRVDQSGIDKSSVSFQTSKAKLSEAFKAMTPPVERANTTKIAGRVATSAQPVPAKEEPKESDFRNIVLKSINSIFLSGFKSLTSQAEEQASLNSSSTSTDNGSSELSSSSSSSGLSSSSSSGFSLSLSFGSDNSIVDLKEESVEEKKRASVEASASAMPPPLPPRPITPVKPPVPYAPAAIPPAPPMPLASSAPMLSLKAEIAKPKPLKPAAVQPPVPPASVLTGEGLLNAIKGKLEEKNLFFYGPNAPESTCEEDAEWDIGGSLSFIPEVSIHVEPDFVPAKEGKDFVATEEFLAQRSAGSIELSFALGSLRARLNLDADDNEDDFSDDEVN